VTARGGPGLLKLARILAWPIHSPLFMLDVVVSGDNDQIALLGIPV